MKDASSIKGEFLPNDEIPETLLPILTHLFTNQWPVLEDTANRLSKWYEEQSKSELPIEIPRRLGMHTFSFKGIAEERMLYQSHKLSDHFYLLKVIITALFI
jgi:hypothetical protein